MIRTALFTLLVSTTLGCQDYGVELGPAADAFHDAGPPKGTDSGMMGATDSGAAACPNGMVFDVTITNFAMEPSDLSIPAGSTVRWTNMDPVTHTATEGDPMTMSPAWNTGDIASGTSFTLDFCDPAAYTYFCLTHPTIMLGYTLTVE